MIVVGDTSGIIAALNRSDPEHVAAKAALDAAGQLAISPLTVTEIHQVATFRAGRRAADQLRNHYEDLDLDLVDAVNVALAAKKHTECALTLEPT